MLFTWHKPIHTHRFHTLDVCYRADEIVTRAYDKQKDKQSKTLFIRCMISKHTNTLLPIIHTMVSSNSSRVYEMRKFCAILTILHCGCMWIILDACCSFICVYVCVSEVTVVLEHTITVVSMFEWTFYSLCLSGSAAFKQWRFRFLMTSTAVGIYFTGSPNLNRKALEFSIVFVRLSNVQRR